MGRPFLKMHGLGNDFVILDGRADDFVPDIKFLKAVTDRRRGVGCDQLVVLRKPRDVSADVYLDMYNNDGSPQHACGNVTRCVARLMFEEMDCKQVVIQTDVELLHVSQDVSGLVVVDFGAPRLDWRHIPLASECDTLHVPLELGPLKDPCCVSMGNPHAVFFVHDVAAISLSELGPQLENDAFFPDRCNIEIAEIISQERIRMRVWERGAGITQACGTGAAATLVAAARRGLSQRRAVISMDGGEATIEWCANQRVLLIGPTARTFKGELDDELFLHAKQVL